MSHLDDLARRRPDLFSDADRKKVTAHSEFQAWKRDIDSRSQNAEDAKPTTPVFQVYVSDDPARQLAISIPEVNKNTGPV